MHSCGDAHAAIISGPPKLTHILIKPVNKLRRVVQYMIVLLHKGIPNLLKEKSDQNRINEAKKIQEYSRKEETRNSNENP